MHILRQSTAVDVLIGPFVDATDGNTTDSGANPDIVLLSKNGQALAAKSDATAPTHDSAGYFNCVFDATDTNTIGTVVLAVEGDTGHLPVRHEFQVVEELVYDREYALNATSGDTGSISQAVWGATTRALTVFAHDTGVADTVWKTTARTLTAFNHDTGVSDTVWKEAARTLTAFAHDTGVADTVWKASTSAYTGDTGSVAYAQGRLMAVRNDTGAAHLDAGRLGVTAAVSLDTGATKDAVWQTAAGVDGRGLTESLNIDTGISDTVWKQASRTLTAFALDTGVADTVWKYSTSGASGDTGAVAYAQGRLMAVNGDTGAAHLDAGRLGVTAAVSLDTGATKDAVWQTTAGTDGRGLTESLNIDTGISDTVWKQAARTLTAFSHDTGVADTVWKSSTSLYTGDTGSVAYAQGRVMAVHADTGAAHIINGKLSATDSGVVAAVLDTGKVASAVWTSHQTRTLTASPHDTGIASAVWGAAARTLTAFNHDTGVSDTVWKEAARTLTAFAHDTGVADTVWKASTSAYTGDTGSVAYAQGRLMAVRNDTGAAHLDAGRLGVTAAVSLDTGATKDAVWQTAAGVDGRGLTESLNIDTGISDTVWKQAARTLTAFNHDTGVADTVWKSSTSGYTGDTGSVAYAQGRLMAVRNDTGAAHLDAGRLGVTATSSLDTGATKDAIWQTAPGTDGRGLTESLNIDTGIADAVWKASHSSFTDTGSLGYGVNLSYIRTDTGAADRLLKFAGVKLSDSGTMDTGTVAGDTGAASRFAKWAGNKLSDSGTFDTGTGTIAQSTLDTGATKDAVWQTTAGVDGRGLTESLNIDTGISDTVWKQAARTLTAFSHDTGVADTVWKSSTSGYTGDTGSVGYAQGRVMAAHADTGAIHIVNGKLSATDSGVVAAVLDTGKVAAAVWTNHATRTLTASPHDTGIASAVWNEASRTLTAFANDTGVADAVWKTSVRSLTAFAHDTGIADTVWKASTSAYTGDTGSVAYAQGRLMAVKGDTGAAHLDAGRLGTSAPAASLDTGATKDAIWQTAPGTDGRGLTESLNIDTGIADTVWKYSTSGAVGDTGSVGYAQGRLLAVKGDTGAAHLDAGRLGTSAPAASLDTGATKDAIWQTAPGVDGRGLTESLNIDTGIASAVWVETSRSLTAFALDTGVADTVWKYSTSVAVGDTGSAAYAQGNIMAVNGDTGAAHLDAGRLGVTAAVSLDTGATKDAVWQTPAGTDGRGLTESLNIDTGIASTVWKASGSTYTDTGSMGYAQDNPSDTGLITNAAAIRVATDKIQFDTGANEIHVDTRKVNNVQVKGAGDTGLANTWRPVTEA